jgi:hypothetical protein
MPKRIDTLRTLTSLESIGDYVLLSRISVEEAEKWIAELLENERTQRSPIGVFHGEQGDYDFSESIISAISSLKFKGKKGVYYDAENCVLVEGKRPSKTVALKII